MPHLRAAVAADPELTVRMYVVAPVPLEMADWAAVEATKVLRPLPAQFNFVNCSAEVHPDVCETWDLPTDIRVRFLPKILPPATPKALGMAMWSDSGGSAAIFYSQAIALRGLQLFPAQVLGRTMAHEIVHLLLGTPAHVESGLMRREWTTDDLRMGGRVPMELTSAQRQVIQTAIQLRVAGAEGIARREQLGLAAKPKIQGEPR